MKTNKKPSAVAVKRKAEVPTWQEPCGPWGGRQTEDPTPLEYGMCPQRTVGVFIPLYRMHFKIKELSSVLYEYFTIFREKLHTLFPGWKKKFVFLPFLIFFFFFLRIKFNPSTWLLDGYQCSRVVRHSLPPNMYWWVRWGCFWVKY